MSKLEGKRNKLNNRYIQNESYEPGKVYAWGRRYTLKRLTITTIMLTASVMTLFLTGAKFLDVKLMTNGKILDLDEVIKDLPPGGGNTDNPDDTDATDNTYAAGNVNNTDAAYGNIDSDKVDFNNNIPITIRIEGERIYLEQKKYSPEFLLQKISQDMYKSRKVVLKDAYADYETYLEVKNMLEGLGIIFSELTEN